MRKLFGVFGVLLLGIIFVSFASGQIPGLGVPTPYPANPLTTFSPAPSTFPVKSDVGDINNDGRPELLVVPYGGPAFMYDGATGSLMYTIANPVISPINRFGNKPSGSPPSGGPDIIYDGIAFLGDVNGNGY